MFGELNTGPSGDCCSVVVDRANQRIENERFEFSVKANDTVVIEPSDMLVGLAVCNIGYERANLVGCGPEPLC